MGQPVTTARAPRHRRQDSVAGVEGNERLTAMTGALLLIGFAVEGVTVLEVRRLLVIHVLVGALLIGPVLLKVGSTGYRFVRYYSGSRAYVRKGPPSPVLRVLGPLVVLTSLAVLSTGIVLGIVGPGNAQWMFLHKASFILWFGVMTIHVLNYAPRLPRMLSARPAGRISTRAPDGGLRWLGLVVSLSAGIGIAALAMHLSVKWGISV
jgi:hypothetical protein